MIPAVAAAERGWAVFPLPPGSKIVTLKDWPNRAIADPGRVARHWPSLRHNYGIACGPSGLVVLDLDAHGELPQEWQLPGINDGRDVFCQICEWAGMDWPATFTVFTPSGGIHLYFRAPEGTWRNKAGNTALGPMIDIRAQGGYVVGPGSVTGDGEYVLTDDQDPVPLPRWIARLLAPEENSSPRTGTRRSQSPPEENSSPGRVAGLVRTVAEARPGNRNHALFWAACTMAEVSPDHLGQLADAAAAAGLSAREITATIRSAQRTVTR